MPRLVTDPTAEIVAQILRSLSQTQAEVQSTENAAQDLAQGLEALGDELIASDGSRARAWRSAYSLNRSAAVYTHDVEFLLSEAKVNRLIRGLKLQPVVITDPLFVRLVPDGIPELTWLREAARRRAFADGFLIITRWRLTVADTEPVSLMVVVPATFRVSDRPTLGIALNGAPQFAKPDGTPYDPFQIAPVTMQVALRRRVYDRIQSEVGAFVENLPTIQSGEISLQPSPHTFSIRSTLTLIDRQKDKRRTRSGLWDHLPGSYDQAIRIAKSHIEPMIREKLREQPEIDEIRHLSFEPYGVVIKIYAKNEKTILVIKIKAEVWMTYELSVRNDTATRLFIEALNHDRTGQAAWKWKYEIKNCWPICDRVGDEVKSEIEDNISKNKLLIFPLADLGAYAFSAWGRFDSYGLLIYLNSR